MNYYWPHYAPATIYLLDLHGCRVGYKLAAEILLTGIRRKGRAGQQGIHLGRRTFLHCWNDVFVRVLGQVSILKYHHSLRTRH